MPCFNTSSSSIDRTINRHQTQPPFVGNSSQRVVKEVWKLSPDLLNDSAVHVDALAVLVSYAGEACLQLGLSVSVLRVVRVGQYQLCQR